MFSWPTYRWIKGEQEPPINILIWAAFFPLSFIHIKGLIKGTARGRFDSFPFVDTPYSLIMSLDSHWYIYIYIYSQHKGNMKAALPFSFSLAMKKKKRGWVHGFNLCHDLPQNGIDGQWMIMRGARTTVSCLILYNPCPCLFQHPTMGVKCVMTYPSQEKRGFVFL